MKEIFIETRKIENDDFFPQLNGNSFYFIHRTVYPPDVASERIVGGTDAADGAAPFQCSLQVRRSHFCGCSILSDKWVLTGV